MGFASASDLDHACGYHTDSSKEPRLVGGAQVHHGGKYPWMLSLATGFYGFFYQHRCGAALISDVWVLTAAHCMKALDLKNTFIMGGFVNQKNQDVAQIRKAAKIIIHERFNSILYEQDIALIKLRKPMHFSSLLLPVCLPRKMDYTDAVVTLSGWGRKWAKGPLAEQLMEVHFNVISNTQCMKWYDQSGSRQLIPQRTFLCAGVKDGSKDACTGDSGGPLISKRPDGRAEIVGVVSWGIGCGTAGRPGVYTRISKYLDWIRENVDKYADKH